MSSRGAVDWDVARSVAARVNRSEPGLDASERARMEDDFAEFTELAEKLVAEETGLVSADGPARGRVADREMWVDVNIRSFQRLLKPLLDQMDDKMDGPFSGLGSKAAGAEVGAMLGWMSGKVLGQYDLLVIEDEDPDLQDIVYYVGPNVAAIEKRFAFPPRDFRLWLALHEVTHRAQFTGVPWMRQHFLDLVGETLDDVDPDPQRFVDGVRRLLEARRAGEDPLADGGLPAVFATEKQRAALEHIGGLMSLLEGHGDITMDRAGVGIVERADRFARVLHNRRRNTTRFTGLLQKLTGIDAKMQQYQQGEAFIEAVEETGGRELLDRVWEGPSFLPALAEIREPDLWVERVSDLAPTGGA